MKFFLSIPPLTIACFFMYLALQEGLAGYTALHLAVERDNRRMVEHILEHGKNVDVETLTYGHNTAYQLAAERNHTEIAEMLEKHGCEPISPYQSEYEDSDSDEENASDNN